MSTTWQAIKPARLTPQQWESQWQVRPDSLGGCSLITVTHPIHGVKQFYLPLDKFQENLVSLVATYWVNNFTIIIQEASNV